MIKPKSVGIVYGFSEANHAVFQNAGLWALNQEAGTETWGYAPREYLGLYWSLDNRVLISPSPYRRVHDVYHTQKSIVTRRNPKTWMSSGARNHLKNITLSLLTGPTFHKLPARLRHDFKSQKFLFDSGVFKVCETHFMNCLSSNKNSIAVGKKWSRKLSERERGGIFLGTGMYRDLQSLKVFRHDLIEHFQTSFGALENQLSSGVFAPFGREYLRLVELEQTNPEIREIISWLNSRSRTIFLRTRNIENNVSFQNAQPNFLAPVVRILLDEGVGVINSGIPPMRLNISHENYREFDHHLPIDVELSLSTYATRVMNTAWAGLFTAVSTLNHPLITFDHEWSVENLPNPISLLRTRQNRGVSDINLAKRFYEESPLKVAKLLLTKL